MTRACLPLLVKNPGNAIINVGSVAGRVAYEGGAAYCGAKAAELQITKALRLELSGTGVRVCTVDPGMAETEFSLVRFKGDEARAKKVYEGVEPLTAEDVAEAILWVATRPATCASTKWSSNAPTSRDPQGAPAHSSAGADLTTSPNRGVPAALANHLRVWMIGR